MHVLTVHIAIRLIVLNEKIEDSGVDMKAVMTNPQGTKFEF